MIRYRQILAVILAVLPLASSAAISEQAGQVTEPVLRLEPAGSGQEGSADRDNQDNKPVIALTLDLCMGKTDRRIFDVLVQHNIPAALFVTRLWLQNAANNPVIEQIRANPHIFEIGNHGANHIPAIDNRPAVYGLKTAGSLRAICAEAEGGLQAIKQVGLEKLIGKNFWFRGAAALYSPDALRFLSEAGFSIAGFSVNGDEGASVSEQTAFQHIISARDGDVLIAHMNQPSRPAGAGVAAGILALQKEGYRFIKLSEAEKEGREPHLAAGLHGEEKLPVQIHKADLANFYPNCALLLKQEGVGR